jgi:tripartite-type tricarboxylate transporter receptor subunit TctC
MPHPSSISRRHVIGALAALGLPTAHAQVSDTYPRQAIRLVVPYPAGGATDTLGRLMATKLQEAWSQSVVVENKPGASGTIGNDLVAKSAPDGYTVLLAITAIVQVPALMPNLPYDVMKDLQPLAQVASTNSLLAVPASASVNTLKEFVDQARANPRKFNYGSYGVGTSSHIHGSLLNMQAGLDLAHVPYKGAAPLLTDLRGSQLHSAFIDMATARPHLDSIKALAVTGPRRNPLLPKVPTFAELGYHSFEPMGWFALFMPSGVPAPIAKKFADEANRILHLPDVTQRIEALGMIPGGMPTADFAKVVRDDATVYDRIIREAHIRLE